MSVLAVNLNTNSAGVKCICFLLFDCDALQDNTPRGISSTIRITVSPVRPRRSYPEYTHPVLLTLLVLLPFIHSEKKAFRRLPRAFTSLLPAPMQVCLCAESSRLVSTRIQRKSHHRSTYSYDHEYEPVLRLALSKHFSYYGSVTKIPDLPIFLLNQRGFEFLLILNVRRPNTPGTSSILDQTTNRQVSPSLSSHITLTY